MTATMQVDLLGGVEVFGADPAQLRGSARAVSLLAYLASRAGSPQPRAHLAGVLWPDSTNAQARTNLRRELHHLRALLGDSDCLKVDGDSLSWRCGPSTVVDVPDFLTACQEALTALGSEQREAVEQHGNRALTLYRGPFLPGFYDDWVLSVREELKRTCLDLCDRVATYWMTHDDAAAAIAFARKRVQLEPLEESGYRLLMRAHRGAGDRAGAMRTYHRCASLLERELGIGPSRETRSELDAALAEAEWVSGVIKTDAGSDTPVSRPQQIVGRESEIASLLSAWEGARDRPRLVVVTGEAGVGKTRLVAELARLVRGQDALVASTRCFASAGTVPLAPVAEWLRHPEVRAATKRLEFVWRAEVERLVPEGENTFDSVAGAQAKVDAWQRLRFFEGLARAVLAVERPLLLTLDDVQWCDKASLSWLSFLLSFTNSAPLLIVATARREELEASGLAGVLAQMQGAGEVDFLGIDNLSAQEASRLSEGVLARPVSGDELGLLMLATGGNPFYLVEALRVAGTVPGRTAPLDLHGVLASRLARLPDQARELVGLASAVGRDFTFDLLIEASDQDEDTVVHLVDDLWRRRIFEEQGRGYDFAHDLLREEAYRMLSPPRRWLLHRRLAQALELLYAERPESVAAQLAQQYDRSGRPERALPYYESAARRATAVFAHAESVRLWQRCLELLADLPPSSQRDRRELGVLQELLPPMNAWRGYASMALEEHERRTAVLGERLGLDDVRGAAAIALFATAFVQGHTAEAHQWGQQALALSAERPGLAARAHLAVAGSGLSLGLCSLADEHFRLACDLACESDSLPIGTRTEVHARSWWAHARWLLGDETGAASVSATAVEHARRIDHPYSLAVALAYAALTHQLVGDLDRLSSELSELSGVCERYGFAYYREWAAVLTGWVEGGASGTNAARLSVESLEREGSLARMPYWLWLVADLHRRQGDTTSAIANLDAAAAMATEHDDRWWLPEVLRTRSALDAGAGAVTRLEKAAALARSQSSVSLLNRCLADLQSRD